MRQVIFSAFATPGPKQANLALVQPRGIFKDETIVVDIGMSGTGDNTTRFANTIKNARNPTTGRVLPKLLANAGIRDVDRVAIQGFSAGRAAIHAILQNPADRDAIDAVIDYDGLHLLKSPSGTTVVPQSMEPWSAYGAQAFDGTKMLVTSHTHIASPSKFVFSTTESNKLLFDALREASPAGVLKPDAVNIAAFKNDLMLNPPILIRGQAGDVDRLVAGADATVSNVGNAWEISVNQLVLEDGKKIPTTGPASHIYTAYYVQGAIWKQFLIPRWNGNDACTVVSAPKNIPPIVVYSLNGCPACKAVKAYLDGRGLPYKTVDAGQDEAGYEAAQKRAQEQGATNVNVVPIVDIGGKMVAGFNKAAIDAAVGISCTGKTTRLNQKDLDDDIAKDPRKKTPQPSGGGGGGVLLIGGIGLLSLLAWLKFKR